MADGTGVRQLLNAGVHFGHQTKRWNPKMKRFIFGKRSGIYIIDLEKTEVQLKLACDFLSDVAAKGQTILFIGTKKQAKRVIEEEAQRCGQPYVINRWLGGTMTNFNTIKKNINRYLELRKQKDEGIFGRMSKKDAKRHERELAKLSLSYASLATLMAPPAVLYVVDPKRENNAVHEANRLKIPIVAICDTNADPDLIAHPIPGNDDAIRSVKLITSMLANAIISGRRRAGLPLPGDEAQAAAEVVSVPADAGAAEPAPTVTGGAAV